MTEQDKNRAVRALRESVYELESYRRWTGEWAKCQIREEKYPHPEFKGYGSIEAALTAITNMNGVLNQARGLLDQFKYDAQHVDNEAEVYGDAEYYTDVLAECEDEDNDRVARALKHCMRDLRNWRDDTVCNVAAFYSHSKWSEQGSAGRRYPAEAAALEGIIRSESIWRKAKEKLSMFGPKGEADAEALRNDINYYVALLS